MSITGGRILNEDAYAQGKMVDSSGFEGFLPRGITPSDLDMFFDGKRKTLGCEFKRIDMRKLTVDVLSSGQRQAFFNIVGRGRGTWEIALCSHNVPQRKVIDAFRDVWVSQVIRYRKRGGLCLDFRPHCLLRDYVKRFYDGN